MSSYAAPPHISGLQCHCLSLLLPAQWAWLGSTGSATPTQVLGGGQGEWLDHTASRAWEGEGGREGGREGDKGGQEGGREIREGRREGGR